MNLAVCLAGCLDVTPLKGLFYVVPPWFKPIISDIPLFKLILDNYVSKRFNYYNYNYYKVL